MDFKMDEQSYKVLKSIGIAVYVAHIGFPVPAKQLQTTVFNGLLTTINLADNIENGLSHYYRTYVRFTRRKHKV